MSPDFSPPPEFDRAYRLGYLGAHVDTFLARDAIAAKYADAPLRADAVTILRAARARTQWWERAAYISHTIVLAERAERRAAR